MGGFAGGFVGNPADLVNVRMQNDIKLPPEQRRKYVFIIKVQNYFLFLVSGNLIFVIAIKMLSMDCIRWQPLRVCLVSGLEPPCPAAVLSS